MNVVISLKPDENIYIPVFYNLWNLVTYHCTKTDIIRLMEEGKAAFNDIYYSQAVNPQTIQPLIKNYELCLVYLYGQ